MTERVESGVVWSALAVAVLLWLCVPVVAVVSAGEAAPPKAADPKPPAGLTITAGSLNWADGTIRFTGQAEAAAIIVRQEFKLYTFEKAEDWRKKSEAEFKDFTLRPIYNGYRVQLSATHAVERYEAGLKFIGKWDESAIAVFEKALEAKRIVDAGRGEKVEPSPPTDAQPKAK